MILVMLRCAGWSLKRDFVALAMSFALPIVFFSIFAGIFGNMAGDDGGPAGLSVAVVDEDGSDASRRMVEALQANGSLRVRLGPARDEAARYDRATAEKLVRDKSVSVAIVFPKGFGESFGNFAGGAPTVDLIADPIADPVSHQMVAGLLQGVAMTAAPDLMIEQGLGQFDKWVGMTPDQKRQIDGWLGKLREQEDDAASGGGSGGGGVKASDVFSGMVRVSTIDVSRNAGEGSDSGPTRARVVAFYAAAIGVMFLLFSMSGAMASLLEEEKSGTLERLLNSRLGMGRLLLSYWLFAAVMGFVQLTVMFLWGWGVFGLDFWTPGHVAGFAVMTAVSAAAASGFGMMLGTVCRSEGQLRGISTIVILVMSAVGGSMFPRFLMPPAMQKVGLATFNGWAIDGYQKIFHHDQAVWTLWPQVLVLAGMTLVFLAVARLSARRWESA